MTRILDSVKSAVHPLAKSAFSVSGSSGLYDRSRPSYPAEALSAIASVLPSASKVIELGPGTGIFTRRLLDPNSATLPKLGSILAVEPAEGMRESFSSSIDAAVKEAGGKVDVKIVDGSFDKIPAPDAGADLLVAAQAYHWIGFDKNFQDVCIAEAARVLKPGGHFALIWNLEDREAARWVASIRDNYERYEADTPQYRRNLWRPLFDTPSFRKYFALLPEGSPATAADAKPTLDVKRKLPTTLQGVKDRVLSKSYITALPEQEQNEVIQGVEETWNKAEDLEWQDREAGVALYPYATHLYLIKRL